ncbi:54S ribosomal protein L4 mitochondrial [Thecaphora frezii]
MTRPHLLRLGIRHLCTTRAVSQAPVPLPTKPASSLLNPSVPRDQLTQLLSYPSHPLLQFFHLHPSTLPTSSLPSIPTTATLNKSDANDPTAGETVDVPFPHAVHSSDLGKDGNGRSWLAAELRTKSSKDLHTLWYVLLMERNRLATSWEELGRVGGRQAAKMWKESLSRRNHRVRKSMARIKLVLNERRLALLDAQQQVRQGVQSLHEDGLVDPADAEEGELFEQDTVEPANAEKGEVKA